MRTIPLTQGKDAIVDNSDYEELSKYKWCLHGGCYAARGYHSNGKLIIEKMHQRILGTAPPGYEIDHINGNTLDNRKENLRFVTHQQNVFNSNRKTPKNPGTTHSGYKGVLWRNDRKKWRVSITCDGIRHYIGLYENKHEAARAYNEAARRFFGQYAKLNKIKEDD